MKTVLSPWIAILAATILIIGTNAGIIGSSRLAYSMASHRQLPPILGRVHPTRFTPYMSIILFGTIAAILLIPGRSAARRPVRLRRHDLVHRGARVCGGAALQAARRRAAVAHARQHPVRGNSIPVLAVIGGLGPASVWLVVVITHVHGAGSVA